jgi:dTDP-D-glucose 4,6-dehydratase
MKFVGNEEYEYMKKVDELENEVKYLKEVINFNLKIKKLSELLTEEEKRQLENAQKLVLLYAENQDWWKKAKQEKEKLNI